MRYTALVINFLYIYIYIYIYIEREREREKLNDLSLHNFRTHFQVNELLLSLSSSSYKMHTLFCIFVLVNNISN